MDCEHVRLVEEDNTIYEIDLDCIRRKQKAQLQEERGREDCKREGKRDNDR